MFAPPSMKDLVKVPGSRVTMSGAGRLVGTVDSNIIMGSSQSTIKQQQPFIEQKRTNESGQLYMNHKLEEQKLGTTRNSQYYSLSSAEDY